MNLQEKVVKFNQEISPEGWMVNVQLNSNTPVLTRGLEYLESGKDMLLALCLNNGYYNRENIYRMLKFALSFSKRVQVFSTEGPARHNYRAFGRSEKELIRDTRLAKNRLYNQCLDGLARINVQLPPDAQRSVTLLEWETIYADTAYKNSYTSLKKLYTENTSFQDEINGATRNVLSTRIEIKKEVESKLFLGIEYILEELAFLISYPFLSPKTKPIADHGTKGFNELYYESWPVFERLVNGDYDELRRERMGFTVARVEILK